ncbi:CBS domain protein [Tamaricihabitans halophyticus]|uniref:CBS domain protein n=1 Tax=Tamaricihabitans halophyticus TaxID=1262583 RepID=A0A4R2Q7G0_9PSEU|nr:CBS domain-containing protein [Tamaricihabitans halophyticus]TCP42645.1 CBS domain protein [Tamaricihabitans halophyticus]
MTTVRDVLRPDPVRVREGETVQAAAEMLARYRISSVPVVTELDEPRGMLADHDIVVWVVARGRDPRSVRLTDLAQHQGALVNVDDHPAEAMRKMSEQQVRRLPVAEHGRVVGMVAWADLARSVDDTDDSGAPAGGAMNPLMENVLL